MRRKEDREMCLPITSDMDCSRPYSNGHVVELYYVSIARSRKRSSSKQFEENQRARQNIGPELLALPHQRSPSNASSSLPGPKHFIVDPTKTPLPKVAASAITLGPSTSVPISRPGKMGMFARDTPPSIRETEQMLTFYAALEFTTIASKHPQCEAQSQFRPCL